MFSSDERRRVRAGSSGFPRFAPHAIAVLCEWREDRLLASLFVESASAEVKVFTIVSRLHKSPVGRIT